MTGMEPVLLVRYGEVALKGQNRPFFLGTLVRNLEALAGPGVEARARFGRILLTGPAVRQDARAVLERARRVFGVVSLSPALEVPAEPAAILQAAETATAAHLARRAAATFKVDARRADKRFPLTSLDLNRAVGAHLAARFGLRVDVHRPDLTVRVEVRDRAYVATEVVPGPGGLPVGTGARAVVLLSGGIDSPVALWLAARRGLVPVAVHFHSFPFTGERSRQKVLDLARVLATSTGPLRVWVVHFTEIQRAIQLAVPEALRVTVMRRMMMRLAERIAALEGAAGLVTGESVGQVASQTLESIGTIEAATTLPVLRPLSGMDKSEIVARARAIGTYEISVLPYEDCCSLFLPAHPHTHPTRAEAERAEAGLDIPALLTEAVERSEVVTVSPGEQPALAAASVG